MQTEKEIQKNGISRRNPESDTLFVHTKITNLEITKTKNKFRNMKLAEEIQKVTPPFSHKSPISKGVRQLLPEIAERK